MDEMTEEETLVEPGLIQNLALSHSVRTHLGALLDHNT